MKRRRWLEIAGGGGLLAAAHLAGIRPSRVRALGPGPKKLLMLYVPGGWMPELFFSPLSRDEIARFHTRTSSGVFECFDPDELGNLDGSGEAPAESDGRLQRLRVPRTWLGTRPNGRPAWSLGRAWEHYALWENALVVHGVDHETASHESGVVSSFSGVPNGTYLAPSIQAWAASQAASHYPDRILASVRLGRAPRPASVTLPAIAAPVEMGAIGDLALRFSDYRDEAWAGLRERPLHDVPRFASSEVDAMPLTPMDAFAMGRARELRGRTTESTDGLYQDLYDGLATASRTIASDVVSLIQRTPGYEGEPVPWVGLAGRPFSTIDSATGATAGDEWEPQLDLALRLLKSDLSTAVTARVGGLGDMYLDTHSFDGYIEQFRQTRAVLETIGRLLGEMKRTPRPGGGTLLDETLVLVTSEFARTWPKSFLCDHWPTTSVVLAGGGILTNRALGGFALDGLADSAAGPIGRPVSGRAEGVDRVEAVPRARDIVYTALTAMGMHEGVFIPSGPVLLDGVIA